MKFPVKSILGGIFGNSVVGGVLRFMNSGLLRVIYYHRVARKGECLQVQDLNMFVDEDQFARQMTLLQKSFSPVSEGDIMSALEGGKKLPPNPVWVTFDDGFKDNFILAYPILKEHRIPATFFVTTGYVNRTHFPCDECLFNAFQRTNLAHFIFQIGGQTHTFDLSRNGSRMSEALRCVGLLRDKNLLDGAHVTRLFDALGVDGEQVRPLFMSWDDILTLSQDGFSIGAHTVTHPSMAFLSEQDTLDEVGVSKSEIETHIGRPVYSFAYPFGKKKQYAVHRSDAVLAKLGIRLAVTTEGGANSLRLLDRFQLKRFGTSRNDPLSFFQCKVISSGGWQVSH